MSDELNFDGKPSRKSSSGGSSMEVWDMLSILVLIITACIGVYFVIVFFMPNSNFNILPPGGRALASPSPTMGSIQLQPTWTASPTLELTPSNTPRPTFTPFSTNTPFSLVPPTRTPRPPTATSTPKAPFGAISASKDTAIEAIKLGAYDYISKPFKADEVLITLRKAEERERLIRENRELRRTLQDGFGFENITARSPKMRSIVELIHKVVDYRSSVLILGESGAGKELLGQTIHFNSIRRDGPFLTMHCGAVPGATQEAELFGREAGVPKEMAPAKRGLFEQAQGGTLFLDEVSALTPLVQVRLLEALQGGVVRRAGGDRSTPRDVRVIAASTRSLEKEVEEGRFREDLYG